MLTLEEALVDDVMQVSLHGKSSLTLLGPLMQSHFLPGQLKRNCPLILVLAEQSRSGFLLHFINFGRCWVAVWLYRGWERRYNKDHSPGHNKKTVKSEPGSGERQSGCVYLSSWTNCESTGIYMYMYKLWHPSLPGFHYTVYSAYRTHRITGLLESAPSILASLQCKYSMIQFAIWNVILFDGWQIVDERGSNCYVLT